MLLPINLRLFILDLAVIYFLEVSLNLGIVVSFLLDQVKSMELSEESDVKVVLDLNLAFDLFVCIVSFFNNKTCVHYINHYF